MTPNVRLFMLRMTARPASRARILKEQLSEESGFTGYYNNFFNTYKLGPEDVISVEVFNQPRYSRSSITIPPSGRV